MILLDSTVHVKEIENASDISLSYINTMYTGNLKNTRGAAEDFSHLSSVLIPTLSDQS